MNRLCEKNVTLHALQVLHAHDFMAFLKTLDGLITNLANTSGPDARPHEGIGESLGLVVVDSLSSLFSPLLTRMHHQGENILSLICFFAGLSFWNLLSKEVC